MDPDVEALLNDLPRLSLPDALVEAGWGQRTIADYGTDADLRRPTVGPLQPTYSHTCVMCGRPVTQLAGSTWVDHSHHGYCDGALLDPDDPIASNRPSHMVSQDDVAQVRRSLVANQKRRERLAASAVITPEPERCMAGRRTRGTYGHRCVCHHDRAHFGFHECHRPDCRRLWR